MRTTLDLDDDVVAAVRALARERGQSLGEVVSGLLREALRRTEEDKSSSVFPVFQVHGGAPSISPEMVREALEGS